MTGECFWCHRVTTVEKHHVFEGTSNRKNSEKDKLFVYLCPECHRTGNESAHGRDGKETRQRLHEWGERKWLEEHPGAEIGDFIRRYGRNYIEDEDGKETLGEW